MNDVQVVQESLSAAQMRQQVNLIQEVMKDVMQEGQHYGKIPGCGDKPTLLKPGAEKLSMVFRLRPIINNGADVRIDHMENGHREVTVYCHVMNMQGVELSTGVGSCTTMESKYRYRGGEKIPTGRPVPKGYWDARDAGDKSKMKELLGGEGFGVSKVEGAWEVCEMGAKMENPDIADVYNTVLKIAKKRAYVDGVLSSTGASDIFTQDIEDMAPADLKQTTIAPAANNDLKKPQAVNESAEDAVMYMDIITMLQGTKGAKLNVIAFAYSVKFSEKPDKNDKAKKWDISEYSVGDLAQNPTATAVIKVFGKPLQITAATKLKFHNVEVGEYSGKPQYVAKEAVI